MTLAVEVDLDMQTSAECFYVSTETADLSTRNTTAFECTHPLLGDAQHVGEFGLCEVPTVPQVAKDIDNRRAAEVAAVE